MSSGETPSGGYGQVPRLAADRDPKGLRLSPEEGFLLSRIDGHTPWRVLREMGGLPPEEVDLCLESWAASGVVVMQPPRPAASRDRKPEVPARPTRPQSHAPGRIDESQLDPNLFIDVATQRRILEFEAGLARPYHELLGVARDADSRVIKRAYFALSKEFHPDRYFRRDIGGYVPRLERIFKKILEAHEILSDDTLRAQIESVPAESPPAAEAKSAPGPGAAAARAQRSAQPLSKIERLRQRMPFKIPEAARAERRQKAAEFIRSAKVSEQRGRWSEAAASVRVAISFDPFDSSYREQLAALQARTAEARAAELLARFENERDFDRNELKHALELLEGVLLYRPHDPEINYKAGCLALELEKLAEAREYAQAALAQRPEVAAYHGLLGRVYAEQADLGHAREALEKAIALDPDDAKSRKALASLRIGRKRSAGGGAR